MKTIIRDFVVYGTVSERGEELILSYFFDFFLTSSQRVKSIHFELSVVWGGLSWFVSLTDNFYDFLSDDNTCTLQDAYPT